MSQITNLRYSITLNDAQLDYLSDEQQDILRMKCLKTFIRMAVLEETKVSGKNYSAPGVQPDWYSPVGIVQPDHHSRVDLLVSLVHPLGNEKEQFL